MNRNDFNLLADWLKGLPVNQRDIIGWSLVDQLSANYSHFNTDKFVQRARISDFTTTH